MLNRMFRTIVLAGLLAIAFPLSALADDWVAVKLRGIVLQLVDGDWAELRRGDVVPDDRVIRTLQSGRVEFQRDAETISVGNNSQIQIKDKTGQRYTTVKQHFGTVEIEAEVKNVKHFAVETPFLAAVVKGTRFIVKTTPKGSTVQVKRGVVEVTDNQTGVHAMIPAGQTAAVAATGGFEVTGKGADKTQVVGATGVVVSGPGVQVGVTAGTGGVQVGVGVTTPVVDVDAGVVVGTDGVEVDADVGGVVGVGASVGGGGVTTGVTVGGTGVGASVGGGGVSVSVGGLGISLF